MFRRNKCSYSLRSFLRNIIQTLKYFKFSVDNNLYSDIIHFINKQMRETMNIENLLLSIMIGLLMGALVMLLVTTKDLSKHK